MPAKSIRPIKTCVQCGAEYWTYPSREKHSRFCSNSCLYASRGPSIDCVCGHCGRTFKVMPNEAKRGVRKFCSRVCRHAPRRLIDHPDLPGALLVPLTQGAFAIIDAEDGERVAAHTWYLSNKCRGKGYAYTNLADRTHRALHRLILDVGPDLEIDHISGDPLDNRRSNLRPATRTQNASNTGISQHNTSGYKGVSWCKQYRRWSAEITSSGQRYRLGKFHDAREAARAYDAKARELRGEFAWTNFPE